MFQTSDNSQLCIDSNTEGPPVANSCLLPNARNIHCSVIVKVS